MKIKQRENCLLTSYFCSLTVLACFLCFLSCYKEVFNDLKSDGNVLFNSYPDHPPGHPGGQQNFCAQMPGGGETFLDECPGAGKKLLDKCPGAGNFAFSLAIESITFIVSDVVNCFRIWYSEGTQRISDTFNTF